MTATPTHPTTTPRRTGAPRAALRGGAAVGAALASLVAWTILTGPLDIVLRARMGPELGDITAIGATVAALVAGLGGWAVAAQVERRAARPRRRWLQISLFVAITSLGSPVLNADGADAVIGLIILHLVTALVVIPVVSRTLPTVSPSLQRPQASRTV